MDVEVDVEVAREREGDMGVVEEVALPAADAVLLPSMLPGPGTGKLGPWSG